MALVNGERLLAERFALVQGVDAAMAALLQAEPATPAQLLEQVINHTLVMQQIAAARLTPATDGAGRLAELLAAGDKTEADLAAALAAAGVERSEFDQYFAELLAVEQFAHQSAEQKGGDVDAYITGLQEQARISYGPAATAIRGKSVNLFGGSAAPEPATSPAANATGLTDTATMDSATVTGTAPAAATVAAGEPEPASSADTASERGLSIGQLPPDFALPVLGQEGEPTTLAALLGKPTVLSFWTTWCPYCLRQTPILVAEAKRQTAAPAKGSNTPVNDATCGAVCFVGIDVAEDAAAVAAYVEQHNIPYPILLDQDGRTAAAYAVEGYPTTYFLDAAGHIVARHIGSLSEEQLSQYVEQLLAPRF